MPAHDNLPGAPPVGQRIYRLRTTRTPRLTQQQLAERAGVSIDVIQKLEQGRKASARLVTLTAIAAALGVDVAALVSRRFNVDEDGLVPAKRHRAPAHGASGSAASLARLAGVDGGCLQSDQPDERGDAEEWRDQLLNAAAADGDIPQTKIKAELREIEQQRQHLTDRLNETSEDLSDSARLIEVCLKLLESPQELYRRCDDEQRRLLNQAIFHGIYIEDEQITDHELKEPFGRLHAVQNARQLAHSDKPDPGTLDRTQNPNRTVPPTKEAVLLRTAGLPSCWPALNRSRVLISLLVLRLTIE